uniref:Uncharacterized protein n=1 Tax=Ananas comosus var. bracteatus TaxID=296719 RepID=A0A6V7Q7P3_ANACO|nr:unnamed protein product [Ananas comosus var. bracteatus]
MRVPITAAKPLFSPGRGRRRDLPPAAPPSAAVAAPPSLSASHSRRLRGSGSLKGAHSPMFAAVVAAGAPGGGGAATHSRPKKKKSKKAKLRSRSKRAIGGEVSLRRTEEEEEEEEEYYCKNQGWACQIPASICEALRGAVSELNCFFLPCVGRSKPIGEEEAKRRRSSAWPCGAALARWVMAVEASEGRERGLGGGEVVEVVVEEEAETGRGAPVGEAKAEAVETEEKGRVSVCVPPRNALLLMRCRSDPVRIAALESKFWGSPATKGQVDVDTEDDDTEDDDDDDDDDEEKEQEYDNVDGEDTNQEDGSIEAAKGHKGVVLGTRDGELGKPVEGDQPTVEVEGAQRGGKEANEEEAVKIQLQGEAEAEMELKGDEEGGGEDEEVKAEGERKSSLPVQWQRCDSSSQDEKRRRRHSISSEREARRRSLSNEEERRRASFSVDCEARRWWSFSIDQKEDLISELNASAGLELEKEKECSSEPELAKENIQGQAHEAANEGTEATSKVDEAQEAKIEDELKEEEEEEERDKCGGDGLPDCLLLMMYEPKLSMEVSKETWVSSNHFLHWHPHYRPRHPSDDVGANGAEAKTNKECKTCVGSDGEDCGNKEAIKPVNRASPPPPPPPPPAARTAQVVEQKLKPAVQTLYQPFVLTRCKSEPMRSAARLAPDVCFWKDRYRPIGAAGIGF